MRIIRKGNHPDGQKFRGTCTQCKTIIECKKSEGTWRSSQRDPCSWVDVKCPTCGNTIHAYPKTGRGR